MSAVGAVDAAFVGFGLLLLGIAAYAFRSGGALSDRGSRIADTERSPAGGVEPGPVKLTGTVRASDGHGTIEAPISGTDAVATRVAVDELRGGTDTSGYRTLHERESAVPFLVADDTATVLVDPGAARVDFDPEREHAGVGESPSPRVREFVETAEVDESTREELLDREKRRYTEGAVAPGDTVFVFGEARRADGWDGPEHVVDGPADGEFIVSEHPEDDHVGARSGYGRFMYAVGGFLGLVGVLLVLAGLLI